MPTQDSPNPFSAWIDMSKNAWDFWSKTVQQAAPPATSAPPPAQPGAAFGDTFKAMMGWNPFAAVQSWPSFNPAQFSPASFGQGAYQQWADSVRNFTTLIPSQPMKDAYERFFSSYQLFNQLQDYWQKYLQTLPQNPLDPAEWTEFFKPISEQYRQVTANILRPFSPAFMPDLLKNAYEGNLESVANVQKLMMELIQPAVDASPELQALWLKFVQGDRDAYIEFLRQAGAAYKEISSRVLGMPAMGGNRKLIEKTQKLLDQYINYMVSANEYSQLFNASLAETMEKLVGHLVDLQNKGESPATFLEFYKLWSDFNEKAFLDLFASDGFERVMNDTVSAGSRLKILYDDFLQDA
ncbi:MAG: hypothetical protein LBS56_06960, partial [Propionibacteriaceae bacterium]|nr:hypothetical protein [Propionibacteriaceae bacterium]